MREILSRLVGEDASYKICPQPTVSGDMITTHGYTGIEDPELRRRAMQAVQEAAMDERRGVEHGASWERAQVTLAQAGFALIEMHQS